VQLGRTDEALRRLDELLAAAPGNPVWIARRGELLAATGRPDAARAELARALVTLNARPGSRRGARMLDLERRLRAALDTTEKTP
jgi:predicted Zn-dependent protease